MADDVASLGLSVSYTDIDSATRALDGLSAAATKTDKSVEGVEVTARRANKEAANLSGSLGAAAAASGALGQNTSAAKTALDSAARGASGAAGSLNEAAQATSEVTNRINALVGIDDPMKSARQSALDMVDALEREEAAFSRLRGSVDPAYKAVKDYEQVVKEAERAVSLGAASQEDANHVMAMAKRRLNEATKETNWLSEAMGKLRVAAAALGVAFGVREIVRMADTWSDLTARVDIATGNIGIAGETMQRLQQIARGTYSSLELTAEGFIYNNSVLSQLGYTTDQTLDYVTALNNALVVSGARGERAARVQDALSRAMALGKLSGDQLNAVIESGGRVAEVLAEEMGVTTLELRRLGAEGQITGDIIYNALTKRMEELEEQAGNMPATIGDAFTLMGNSVLAFVGNMDQATGASETIANAIIWVADNLQRLATYAATAAAFFAGQWVVGFVAAGGATTALGAAVNFLRANIVRLVASTGIGLVIVAAGELIHQFLQLTERTGSWGAALEVLGRVASGVWAGIVTSAGAIPPSLSAVWNEVQAGFLRMIKLLLQIWNEFLAELEAPALTISIGGTEHEIIGGLDLSNWKANIGDMDSLIGGMTERAAELRAESAALASEGFAQVGSALSELTAIADEAGDAMERVVNPGGAGVAGAGGGAPGGGGASAATENLLNELQTQLDALREHFMSEEELLTQQFTRNQELLTAAREAELISMREHNELKLNIEREYGAQLAQIQAQQYTGALNAAGDFFGALAGVMGGENEAMLKMQRTFAAASALINAWLAASQVLADPTIPFWGKFAAVASVVTAGLNMVNAIKSGSSSASGRGGGGSSSSAPSAAPAQPQMTRQAVEINVQGDVFTKETVLSIMDQINELSKDNHMLVVNAR